MKKNTSDTGMDHLTPDEHLLLAAQQIVADFISWGEVLQSNDKEEYGPGSAIYELAIALNRKSPDAVDISEIWTPEEEGE